MESERAFFRYSVNSMLRAYLGIATYDSFFYSIMPGMGHSETSAVNEAALVVGNIFNWIVFKMHLPLFTYGLTDSYEYLMHEMKLYLKITILRQDNA